MVTDIDLRLVNMQQCMNYGAESRNIHLDTITNKHEGNLTGATKALKKDREDEAWNHIQTLSIQGALLTNVSASLTKTSIKRWSTRVATLAAPLFKFVRKAIQQQLPTAKNLKRWGKTSDSSCPLCTREQTNKHVLSNCSATAALERYKTRHDNVLLILAEWISSVTKPGQSIYVDINSDQFKPVLCFRH